MPTTTHNPNITVNVTLDPSPLQEAGFGTVLLLVPLAANSLNGDRTRTWTSYEDALADNTAGYISSGTLAAAEVAFSQRPKPAELKVGYVDLAGGTPETYATGLAACIADDDDFYGVCMTSRTSADIAVAAGYIEAASKKMLLVFQSAASEWFDGDVPAALASIDENERAAGFYHDVSAEWADVGFLSNRLVYDPDERSAPWHGFPISGVDSYTTAPTAAERLGAIDDAHINLGLPYGGQDFVADPGVNLNNRPLDEILTADWFSTRLQERTAVLVVQHGARGEKIVVSKAGQKKILALIDGLLQQGVAAGHFVEGQTSARAEAITSSDLTARKMRFTVRAQLAVSARIFVFNCYFSRDPITE